MALGESVTVFKRVYNDPGALSNRQEYESWENRYNLNWSYYIGNALEELGKWTRYKAQNRLYRYTRNIYNPTRRLVDFYAGTIYPGVLTADARQFEDGTQIAIPFAQDTPKALTNCIASLWKWSNWTVNKGLMVRYAAITGECLVEVVDDLESRKINFQVWYPSVVKNVSLDYRGNVDGYTIEYDYAETDGNGDPTGRTRKYKKVVDGTSFRYFRDNEPHDYTGDGSVVGNPYGFVPAAWIKHTDIGTAHGEPCMRYMNKWDELNSIASHWLDNAHRVLEAPLLVSGDNIQNFKEDKPASAQLDNGVRPDAGRTEIPILRGPAGSRIDSAQPPSGDVIAAVDHILEEIEKDHPELTMWMQARKMSQVTGVSLGNLFGDVGILVRESRNNYDLGTIKVLQMGTAIGGYRARNGDWGNQEDLSRDRSVFLAYDLDSYEAGDLDFEIAERPLIATSRWEALQAQRAEVALERERIILQQTQANPAGGDAGLPSGDMTSQIGQRLRMRASTEGAQTTTSDSGPSTV